MNSYEFLVSLVIFYDHKMARVSSYLATLTQSHHKPQCSYHSLHSSRFLETHSLDCLKHVHHALTLTGIDAVEEGNKHATPAHGVAVVRKDVWIITMIVQCNYQLKATC